MSERRDHSRNQVGKVRIELAPSHSFCRCRMLWRGTGLCYYSIPVSQASLQSSASCCPLRPQNKGSPALHGLEHPSSERGASWLPPLQPRFPQQPSHATIRLPRPPFLGRESGAISPCPSRFWPLPPSFSSPLCTTGTPGKAAAWYRKPTTPSCAVTSPRSAPKSPESFVT